jgi:murein L,D-transpeptidase YafK
MTAMARSSLLVLALLVASGAAGDVAEPVAADPEHALAGALAQVARGDLDRALGTLDALIAAQPNFRLAHLVRGDVLAARGAVLTGFGSGAGAAAEREALADLKAEAEARLAALATKPGAELLPASLLRFAPDERHALVYDAQRARLYLFEVRDGRPALVADYYASHGKAGGDKRREGDKRTPTGVYRMSGWLAPADLTDFYGAGAFPISYPNAWDRREGRDGFGIWLHGTPRDTYARAPRASDGCVVLANADLRSIRAIVDPRRTPVVVAERLDWVPREHWLAERDALEQKVERWRLDWQSRDADRYLSHYSAGFVSAEGQDRSDWDAHKRRVLAARRFVEVGVSDLSLQLDPRRPDLAVATFSQSYAADNLSGGMQKRLYLVREQGEWRIAWEGESARDLGRPMRARNQLLVRVRSPLATTSASP